MPEEADADSTEIANLRHQLKAWEKSFAAANGGRKAGREDIKRDATISAKYKEYDRLAKRAKRTVTTPRKSARSGRETQDEKVLKDRPPNTSSTTPQRQPNDEKMLQLAEVPEVLDEGPTPAIVRCALGPTPQKDGEILGIFDMLPAATPSKGADASIATRDAVVGATPSKTEMLLSSEPKQSKTPQSSAKRNFLDTFVGTPLKRRREDEERYTPSTAKQQYATPAFLRRSFPLSRIDEDSTEGAAAAPPFKKRGFVRSLSTIIKGLKKQEEERMDDEWDIMNQIEAEERGEVKQLHVPRVLVEDSQAVEMPLGPDQGVESNDEAGDVDAGALDANGKPRKVWKKKGLKRQTRRVIMRPVLHKPKKATVRNHSDSATTVSEAVEEIQLNDQSLQPADEDEDDEDQGGADDSDFRHDSQQPSRPPNERKSKKTKAKSKPVVDITEYDVTSKKTRKVNPQAHANFRKLKIKNKNSKAKGRGGKFARR